MFKPKPLKTVFYRFASRLKYGLRGELARGFHRFIDLNGQFACALRRITYLMGWFVATQKSRFILKFVGLIILGSAVLTPVIITSTAHALPNSTLNFQARLETSTGSIAPDGNYSVQFKLYDASTGGTSLWTETDGTIRVANGYLTVNLGATTPFPGSINWDDQLYLTMNVAGNGEMSPRLALTSVPYAFQANSARKLQVLQGSNTGTLNFDTLSTNQTITLPNASGEVCLSIGNCVGSGAGSAIGGSGTTGTIAMFTPDGYNIGNSILAQTGTTVGVAGTLQATAALQAPSLDTTAAGILTIGGTNATTVYLATNDIAHSIAIGTGAAAQTITIGSTTTGTDVAIQSSVSKVELSDAGVSIRSDSITLQNGTGTTNLFSTDGVNNIVQVGSATPSATPTIFVLNSYSGAADPTTGVNGAMYYNSSMGIFRCYNDGTWVNCAKAGGIGGVGTANKVAFFNNDGNLQTNSQFAWDDMTGSLTVGVPSVYSYNVGDIGPAGGVIFYDKGNNNGGWQYLEAAPVDISSSDWGCSGANITTGVSLGDGKQNTSNIIAAGCEGGSSAATIAANYIYGSYNDWFLPSQAELNELYGQKSLLGMSSGYWWSSSAGTTATARQQNFDNGSASTSNRGNAGLKVRPIRTVAGMSGAGLYVDTATGRIGVGTVAPGYKIDVEDGTGIVGKFSGRVIGGDAVNSNEFVTLGQANGAYIQNSTSPQSGANFNIGANGVIGGTLSVGGLTTATGGLTTGSDSTLTVGGSTVNTSLPISDLPTGGNIGSAADTVDKYTSFLISQTTAGQTLSIPAPTSSTNGRLIYITNVGTAGYTMSGSIISPGAAAAFIWNSVTNSWSLVSSGTTGNYIQNGTSVQTANFNIQSLSNSSVGVVISGASGQTADILQVSAYGVATPLVSVGASGQTVLQNATNSASALRVNNASGDSVLSVNTSAGQLVLGQSTSVNGALLFNNSTNSNSIKLQSAAPSGNYTYTLPDAGADDVVCLLNLGNCVGGGGGAAIGGGGSANTIAMFTAGSVIADSILSQNAGGTTLTVAGALSVVGTISSNNTITGTQLISTIADGTAPLVVTSTTKVTNLNADLLDGLDSTAFQVAGSYAPASGSANYIQNGSSQQASSNFNISGTGTANLYNSVTGYQFNGTAGSTTSCSGGQFLQNQVVQGGITTAGSCSTAAGITGTGTDGTIAMFSGSGINIGDSILTQTGTASINVAGDLNVASGKSINIGLPASYQTYTTSSSFAGKVNYSAGNFPRSVTGSDLNGDGKPDLITANYGSNNVSVLMNNGNGTFPASPTNYSVGSDPESVTIADVNGDGHPDLIVANNNSNSVSVLINNGNGTFPASPTNYSVGSGPQSVTIADVSGDGHPDIITSNYDDSNVSVLINNGNGTFPAIPTNFSVGSNPHFVSSVDLNGDGKPDLITANYISSDVSVLMNGSALVNNTGTLSLKTASAITAGLILQGTPGQSADYLRIQDSNSNAIFEVDGNGNASFAGTLSVSGSTTLRTGLAVSSGITTDSLTASASLTANSINSVTGYQFNGTSGANTSCSGGQFLQNQVVQGGITTGGTCVSGNSGTITGSGTDGTIAMFSGSGINIGDSLLTQTAGAIKVTG
ncbi:MAG: FG-GAP-like repeat-containing protein, partial [Candidatus Saccharimonadales bacterium]